jgi:uncharacterized cupin superfamily protein
MAQAAVAGGIVKVHGPDASLDPWPIPAEQVLSGNPEANGSVLWQSECKRFLNGIWECAPGSFTWDYTWSETIYLLEGHILITDSEGNETEVSAGDLIFVPAGTKSTWVITEHVRKAYHIYSETPVEL